MSGAKASVTGARAALLRWYDREARDLPWRRTRDPYAIWISEVMLQQTRVETVIPYFHRFIARLPSVAALAAAHEDEVLSLWSGLGYYRRARQLQTAARQVVERHRGVFPRDAEARRELAGIGRYTAGAIGSIAFDREEPIVDGNVGRVLSRVHGIAAPLGTKESETALWSQAERWVKGPRPGALNQALMELGATICAPKAPRCDHCPLASRCIALREDRVLELPAPRGRRAPKRVEIVAIRATDARGRVFLIKSEQPLFGGLYGLPFTPLKARTNAQGRTKAAIEALRAAGLGAKKPVAVGKLVHVLTHRRLTVHLFAATVTAPAKRAEARAFDGDGLTKIGVSTLTRRLLAL